MTKVPPQDAQQPEAGQPVTMAELLSALSIALDITEGARPGHSLRACLLGMRLGKQIGLGDQALADLYYALLLKDIGCSSNSARMSSAFAAEDQVVKQRFKFIHHEKLGKPNREAISFVWNNIASGQGVLGRLRQFYRVVRRPGNLTAEMIEERCERGAFILHKLGMSIDTCAAVYSLDEHWDGQGYPDHLLGRDIPMLGRICGVAQHLDLFRSEFGPEQALETLTERSGTWYDPDLVAAAQSLARQSALWAHCSPSDRTEEVQSVVLAHDPGSVSSLASRDIDLICSGFADVIDAKSPFTYRHSAATTEVVTLASHAMGLAPERVMVLRRAAMLHDIGMLSVPNTLLDKPGPLTASEWKTVHQHPVLSQQILSRVRAFAEIATLAGRHHERLDGSGYPSQLSAAQLSLESRILAAADVFTALMETRSYRQDRSPAEIQQELARESPHRLDAEVVDVIISMLDQLARLPLEDIPAMAAEQIPDLPLVEPPPFRFSALSR